MPRGIARRVALKENQARVITFWSPGEYTAKLIIARVADRGAVAAVFYTPQETAYYLCPGGFDARRVAKALKWLAYYDDKLEAAARLVESGMDPVEALEKLGYRVEDKIADPEYAVLELLDLPETADVDDVLAAIYTVLAEAETC